MMPSSFHVQCLEFSHLTSPFILTTFFSCFYHSYYTNNIPTVNGMHTHVNWFHSIGCLSNSNKTVGVFGHDLLNLGTQVFSMASNLMKSL